MRDLVQRTRILDGRGTELAFGGRVMKNVAGFDVARLMTGALGTLGVLLEISLKCQPLPKAVTVRVLECSAAEPAPHLRLERRGRCRWRNLPSRRPAGRSPRGRGARGRRRGSSAHRRQCVAGRRRALRQPARGKRIHSSPLPAR
ncbi:MAG: hypothetical protein IPO75_11385 [Betaproteobacteria bacterium]|nr:hypothetical protein [Betaproteobacteria bacterium]